MLVRGTEITQVLQGRFWTIEGPTVFLKTGTEGDITRGAGNLFQEIHRFVVEGGSVLAVICGCVLSARLGVGRGRIRRA